MAQIVEYNKDKEKKKKKKRENYFLIVQNID